jgi:type II secretory pathway pseudopilin PulG
MRPRTSPARSDRRPLRREDGVGLFEMVVVVTIMGFAVVTLLAALDRATTTATYSQRRNESLDDLRLMAAAFSKDARQGIEATTALPDEFTFDTYVDGDVSSVTWRAVTSADGSRLERVVDGGLANVYVVELTTLDVFSYFGAVDASDVGRVRLALATRPDERFTGVGVTTEVEMRNVG